MGLERALVVDAVGIEPASGIVVLTIVDSWDWSDPFEHLMALQAKLNAYFEFIEMGQLFESYPRAKGLPVRVDIIARLPIPQEAVDFLHKAQQAGAKLGVTINHTVSRGDT